MRRALIICRKEVKEVFRSRYMLSTFLMPVILFGVIIPAVLTFLPSSVPNNGRTNFPSGFENILPEYVKTDQQRLVYFMSFFFVGPILLMVPFMTPTFIAADSFAGERERKAIEPLLATPLSDMELFLGKVLTAFVPSIMVSFLTHAVASIILGVTSIRAFGFIIFPDLAYLLMMTLVAPLATIMSIGSMVLISARVPNVRDASQFGGLLVLPVVLVLFSQIFNLVMINLSAVLAIALLFGLIDVLLIWAGSSSFGRERILSKL